jgi:hypothetical protein
MKRSQSYADQAEDQEEEKEYRSGTSCGWFQIVGSPSDCFWSVPVQREAEQQPYRKDQPGFGTGFLPSPDVERNERRESERFQKIWQRADHKDDHKAGKRSAPEKRKSGGMAKNTMMDTSWHRSLL